MSTTKRILGLLAMILGAVGVILIVGAGIGRVQLAVTRFQTDVPRWLDIGAAALTFFLIWAGVAQVSHFAPCTLPH